MISGLVLTLSADPALAREAKTLLQRRPELVLGECRERWLPVAAEVADVAAGRDLHDWLSEVPGVEFVDVVQVNFEEDETSRT
ncbi:MAG TPA: hypothetical protein VN673_16245, partial [Clostridia bacterium]|nr:hypothetical protein [Clostridia bacterium]